MWLQPMISKDEVTEKEKLQYTYSEEGGNVKKRGNNMKRRNKDYGRF